MIKFRECLTVLKVFFSLTGIQTLTSWFALFTMGAFVTGDAQSSVFSGFVLLSFAAIPILFSSFVLTLIYKYGIIPRLKEKE